MRLMMCTPTSTLLAAMLVLALPARAQLWDESESHRPKGALDHPDEPHPYDPYYQDPLHPYDYPYDHYPHYPDPPYPYPPAPPHPYPPVDPHYPYPPDPHYPYPPAPPYPYPPDPPHPYPPVDPHPYPPVDPPYPYPPDPHYPYPPDPHYPYPPVDPHYPYPPDPPYPYPPVDPHPYPPVDPPYPYPPDPHYPYPPDPPYPYPPDPPHPYPPVDPYPYPPVDPHPYPPVDPPASPYPYPPYPHYPYHPDPEHYLPDDVEAFPSTESGCDWKVVFKAVGGNHRSVYHDFLEPGNLNTHIPYADHVSSPLVFRDGEILDKWDHLIVPKVKVEMFVHGVRGVWLIFDGLGSTLTNWFHPSHLLASPYHDIKLGEFNHYSIAGDEDDFIRFFINRYYEGDCTGDCGFMAIVDPQPSPYCQWERLGDPPLFIYNTLIDGCGRWPVPGEAQYADRFVISVNLCDYVTK